jgi:hypothetical protein
MALRRFFALTLGILVFAGSTAVASASPSAEAEFVAMINQSRSAAGLAALSVHGDLVVGARNHTAKMIPTDSIFHSTSAELAAVTTGWVTLGENVGRGGDASVLHKAFMASPSHKANILGDFDKVGAGVGHDAEGRMYVTVMFMKSKESAPTTTTTTAPPTTTTTTVPTATTTTTVPTVSVSAPAATSEPAPRRPSAPAVERQDSSPRTLGLGLFPDRWVEGTYCVVVRADGAVCVD